jgi:hypothetical protein
MVLDFILDHLSETCLDSIEAKRVFFTAKLGVEESLLPRSPRIPPRLFPEAFPILIHELSRPCFNYFDSGAVSSSGFKAFLGRHDGLFSALPDFDLTYLADSTHNFERAERIFAIRYPKKRALGVTRMTPRGCEHFLEFLRSFARGSGHRSPRDLEILREGEPIYATLEHQAICAAWAMGSTDAQKIRLRFRQSGPHATFMTTLLPYSYPIYAFKSERRSLEELRSRQRSGTSPLGGSKIETEGTTAFRAS